MSIARRRLSPLESRTAALEAARELLLEAGPQAVTLKAVAGRIQRTHANLLHHFGSASGLQKALAGYLADMITATIGDAVKKARRGEVEPRTIVDLTFDAFDKEGAGALASWMMASGNEDALDPVVEAIHRLALVLSALGDSMMGAPMAKALGLPRTMARDLATRTLFASMALAESPEMNTALVNWMAANAPK